MSINMKNEYDVFIKKFVSDNWTIIDTGKRYRQLSNDTENTLSFIPELHQPAEPEYIGYSAQYKQLVSDFVDNFIINHDFKFDLNGHIPTLDGHYLSEFLHIVDSNSSETVSFIRDKLIHSFSVPLIMDVFTAYLAIRNKTTTDTTYFVFFYGDNVVELKSGHTCSSCDVSMSLIIDYEKKAIVLDGDRKRCKRSNKATQFTVTLNSPSGQLVFLNTPSQFFKLERFSKDKFNLNSMDGCVKESKYYQKHNIGYFFVGNTSVNIMQGNGNILTGSFYHADKENFTYKNYEKCGDVSIDIWWYTVLDYDLYIKLCSEHNVDPASIEHTVVKTNALKYKVSHRLEDHTNGNQWGIYSKITY